MSIFSKIKCFVRLFLFSQKVLSFFMRFFLFFSFSPHYFFFPIFMSSLSPQHKKISYLIGGMLFLGIIIFSAGGFSVPIMPYDENILDSNGTATPTMTRKVVYAMKTCTRTP